MKLDIYLSLYFIHLLLQLSHSLLIYKKPKEVHDYYETFDPHVLLGTKTAYHFIHGKFQLPHESNCSAKQIWSLSRHGTRFPGLKTVIKLLKVPELRDKIICNYKNGANIQLSENVVEGLKEWQLYPDLNEKMANELTRQGHEDLKLFARRLNCRFSDLLNVDSQSTNNQIFKFQSTNSSRTQKSLEAFMEGFFKNNHSMPIESTPANDTLLHAFKYCPIWARTLIEDHVDDETNKFIDGPEYQSVIESVSDRLGFSYKIEKESIQMMYDMCRYETAWEVTHISPWCLVFNIEELKVLEYVQDIKHYYYYYGREINKKIGCPLIKDMFTHFRSLEQGNSESEPKGIFYFSHTVTLQSLMAALDIDRESTPLLASNYRSMARRRYRTSIHGAFGSNLVAVFYRCSDVQSPNKVMFYVNEELFQMEGCKVGLCDWEYLKDRFGKTAEECNLNFCYDKTENATLNN